MTVVRVRSSTVRRLASALVFAGNYVSDPRRRRHLAQGGPMPAGLAIQATTGLRQLPIGPWSGLGVLALWAAGALLVGTSVLHRRDA
jgi:ABC-2 type transport system permease protein